VDGLLCHHLSSLFIFRLLVVFVFRLLFFDCGIPWLKGGVLTRDLALRLSELRGKLD